MKAITVEDRARIYNILAESYLDLVGRGEIGKFERKVVSRKVLDAVEGAKSFEDIHTFLNSLAVNYPAFTTAMVKIRGEINKVHEDQVLSHLQSFLKSASK